VTVTRTAPEPAAVVTRLRTALATPRTVAWVAVPLLVASLVWSWIRLGNYALDLDIYRLGVQTWLSGQDMYGTLPPPMNGPVLPFIYPVFAAIVMIPLSVVPYWVSLLLVFALSVAALTVVIFLTARVAWPAGGRQGAVSATMLAVPASLLIEPVSQTLAFGQINLLLMVMVAVDCLAPRTRWPRGLMIGLAAAIKLTPAGFVLFLLLRRDYRAVAVAAATGIVATGIGFLVAPTESARYWFGGPAASVSGSTFFSNETIQAILARQEVPEPLFTLIWLAGVVVVLALAVPIIRRADRAIALAATAAVVLMASPTSWSHHWVFVVPALIAIGTHAVRLRSWGWAVAGAATAVVFYLAPFRWMPNVWGVQMRWSLWEQTLGASYVIVALVLLGLGCWWYTRRPSRPMAPATAGT
jgi:alpha-1,2-mannosyltransferase